MTDYEIKSRRGETNEIRLEAFFKGEWVSGCSVWNDNGSNHSHVNGLFVAEEDRRKGYGRQMMEYIVSEFADRELSLMVYPDNTGAILLYEQIGFVAEGPPDEFNLQLMVMKGNEK